MIQILNILLIKIFLLNYYSYLFDLIYIKFHIFEKIYTFSFAHWKALQRFLHLSMQRLITIDNTYIFLLEKITKLFEIFINIKKIIFIVLNIISNFFIFKKIKLLIFFINEKFLIFCYNFPIILKILPIFSFVYLFYLFFNFIKNNNVYFKLKKNINLIKNEYMFIYFI